MENAHFNKQYINGAWVDSTNAPNTIDVIDSNTAKVVARVPDGSVEDMDLAIKAAREAFKTWSVTPLAERKAHVAKIVEVFKTKKPQVVDALTKELGCTTAFATHVQTMMPEWHGGALLSKIDEVKWATEAGSSTVVKEPIGVVGSITPWNYPLNQISLKVLPALLAGCTVVLKPSEVTPMTAYFWAEAIVEAGIPAGVFNMVLGAGPKCGQRLAEHPDVDLISFTGSTRAGKQITVAAADTLKIVRTELGGKSAAVLLDDADFEKVVPAFVGQLMANTGQSCNALSRMLVPRAKYAEAVELAADCARKEVVGLSNDPKTTMGPLVSKVQWDNVQRLLQKGVDEGARVVTGGPGKPEGDALKDGYFVKPTIFADVKNDMTIAREEIFGPVLSMIPYDTEEEAVAIANDTIYGLNNAVASSDTKRALRVANQLKSGMVMVNGTNMDFNAPFGGYKQSGNAREWGLTGLDEFLTTKVINVPLADYTAAMSGGFAPAERAAPKKEGKKEGKKDKGAKEQAKPAASPEEEAAKKLKKVIKEGGKRGVEIEGAADMGGLQFFCTSVDEPEGDLELLKTCVEAMNFKSDPTEEERKGGSGHIGKMVFSCGVDQLALVAYVPEEKHGELSCKEWLEKVLAVWPSGKLVSEGASYCSGAIPTDSDKNIFPLKIREGLILEANNFLRGKGLFPEDNGDDSDEMVFGDDDFPS